MIMQRIRLQRKFNLKNKIEPIQRLSQIAKMMIIFELTLIILFCTINFSFHFHVNHVFTSQFWTTEDIINSNLALAICSLLLLPYLIFYEKTTVALVKDLVATALFLHTFCTIIINMDCSLGFIGFIVVLGAFVMTLGNYGAIFREQKKLIDEIRNIQSADRSQMKLREEQPEHIHLNKQTH